MFIARRRAAAVVGALTLGLIVPSGPGAAPASAAGAGSARPPKVTAKAWLVADLETGQIIAARAPHRRLAPASTLKTLTLLALSPKVQVDDTATRYTARHADAAIDGSKVGLVPGSRYRPRDLYHGLMLGSGNDCAHALGRLAGGQAVATALMRAEAARLGAVDTTVRNTSGLDAKGQVSSAYDLALFGRAVLAEPELAALVRTTGYTFPARGKSFSGKRTRFQIQNHNRLLRNYDGALGVKNGYTVAAGGSFIGAARRGGRTYLVTMLKAKGSTWHQARDLLDWAFAHGSEAAASPGAAALGRLTTPEEVRLGAATGTRSADAGPATGADRPQALAAVPKPDEDRPEKAGTAVGPARRVVLAVMTAGLVAVGLAGFGRRRSRRHGRVNRHVT